MLSLHFVTESQLFPQPLTANLHKQSEVLLELEKACRSSRRLEGLCRDFELQKVCYVPLNVFILRPLHRLIHYKQILEHLCKHYPATHVDFRDCRGTPLRSLFIETHWGCSHLILPSDLSDPITCGQLSALQFTPGIRCDLTHFLSDVFWLDLTYPLYVQTYTHITETNRCILYVKKEISSYTLFAELTSRPK